jgi:glycerol kinase
VVAALGRAPGNGVSGLLLGIDEGTTAVKAVLYDLDLRPVAARERRVPTSHPAPGRVERDAEAVLAAVVDAVGELLHEAREPVVACGLDHEGESVLAWDAETGRPLTPIVVWQDKRGQPILDALAPAVAEEVRRLSSLPLDPYFSASKLAWIAAEGLARDGVRLGTVDAFLADRLGAGFSTDASTASRTQLAAPGAPAWDARLCEIFGVPIGSLPPIGDSVGALGVLRHESWPVEVPLTARVVDQQAALAGTGCVEPGRAKATYGTGVFVLAHAGEAPPDAGGTLVPTVAWRIDGRVEYALDGGVFSAGALLEWLSADLGLAADPAAIAALAREAPDSGGVRVLPALAGLGAPWWRPHARAVVAGMTGGTRPAHLARAALEAIAWRVADIVEIVGRHAPLDVLRADGGLSRDDLLLELQASAVGIPVERGVVDATAAGAAALAAVGAGVWESTREIGERVAPGERFAPERDAAWRRAAHADWRAFVEAAAAL